MQNTCFSGLKSRRCAVAALVFCYCAASSAAFSAARDGRRSVVKIYVTSQRGDFAMPWQTAGPAAGSGSGFILRQRRLLTNAHLVSDAKYIEVQKDNDARRFQAEVAFVGHDCDLAVLSVKDESFFEGTAELGVADSLPGLDDVVTVLGYPLGGERLSVTRGVVSRIDYANYMHSGVDQHLVLQVDAAINPGNSGGPVLFRGRVVGLAFQGLSWAENIGYAVPLPVLRHFLDDISDGYYNGYPELGAQAMELRNPALREHLKLPADRSGVAVYFLDPFGSARNRLLLGDILMAVDGIPIADDGTVPLGDTRMPFHEILEQKQWGETVVFDVWRKGLDARVAVPLRNPHDPFIYRDIYDRRPQFLITGGLVFSPLSREYLRTGSLDKDNFNVQLLKYYMQYAKVDDLYKGHIAFIVLIRRLAHPVNAYHEHFLDGILEEVNGRPIGSLTDLNAALEFPRDGYHVMRFAGMDEPLIMDAAAARAADAEILRRYDVPAPAHVEEKMRP